MALQSIGAGGGFLLLPAFSLTGIDTLATSQTALDAAGESLGFIGEILWSDGGSHTVSSAGGKIHWWPQTVGAFANGSTNIRIGIQDVDTTTGLEDGTFDVYDDLVGGTDTITAAAINTATMSSGTKTLAHGALCAVVIEMTARGGADSVSPSRVDTGSIGYPYCTQDTGSGPAKANNEMPYCVVEADDGTFGLLGPPFTAPVVVTTTSFNSGSGVDEYGVIFKVPFRCTVNRLIAFIGELDSGETGNIHLYSAPTGTPVAERTVAVDPDVFALNGATAGYGCFSITEYTLEPNTEYCIAYEATSAGNRSIRRVTTLPGTTTTALRPFTPFITALTGGARADGSGSFAPSASDYAVLGAWVNKLDDGAGSGGGSRGFGLTGGMA